MYQIFSIEEIHNYYLPVMDEIHDYFLRNDIKYSLSGGTLLGAIRHKGFIPWDADVDLMFDRQNYEKFLKIWESDPLPDYEIIGSEWVKRISKKNNPCKETEELCLDLFIFDYIPGSKWLEKIKLFFIKTLQGMIKKDPEYERFSRKNKILLFITHIMGLFFSHETKLNWYQKVSQWKGTDIPEFINIYNTYFEQIGRTRFKKNVADKYFLVDFEDRKYMAIQEFDNYLSVLYGNYLELPKEEDRTSHYRKTMNV